MAQASKGKRIAISVIATLALAVLAFWNLTGLYIVPPIATVPRGETIWFYRRGTGLSFISSADGLNLEHHNGVNPQTRGAMNALVANIIGKHVIAKFGYSQSLYVKSTGNRDFSALEKPLALPSPNLSAPNP
jgi:hypothetical protein